ncbi:MAG TPA: glycosyltransferase family 39 protein [Xanthobacteraceae bacterium]|nr:glycosyltransferase family 39 protein [Xanthobacteraceae bacterium]
MLRDQSGPLEASISVEALRAAPAAMVAAALAVHALVWALAMQLASSSPPPQMAVAIALGREWLLGYPDQPPLAAWISEIIHRTTNSLFAVRLAASLCAALSGWILFQFLRRLVGDRHGAIAVLLMVSVFPVAFPGGVLTGDLLQMPLLAASMLSWWAAVGERNPGGWMLLGLFSAVSLYAGPQGLVLLAVLALVTLASAPARAAIGNARNLFAVAAGVLIFVHVGAPRLLWLWFHGGEGILAGTGAGILEKEFQSPSRLVLTLLMGHAGFLLLIALATFHTAKSKEQAPLFVRSAAALPFRWSVIAIAILPGALALLAFFLGHQNTRPQFFSSLLLLGGAAAVLIGSERLFLRRQTLIGTILLIFLFVPPAIALASGFLPGWFGDNRAANWPAASAARTFTEIFRTRTGSKLEYIAGDLIPAAQIVVASDARPRVVIDADPSRSPWIDAADFKRKGGVVFWEISGADISPPPALTQKLGAITPEAPLRLSRVRGAGEPVRLGWAILPPAP